jgi:endonuclease/exonuclease/phosphatase family metal-dependent hydrolase
VILRTSAALALFLVACDGGGTGGAGGAAGGGNGGGGEGGIPCTAPEPEPAGAAFARIPDDFGDPLTTRLCDEGSTPPDMLANPWDLHCKTSSGRGALVDENAVPSELRVVEWNIEFGTELAGVTDWLQNDPELSQADVILLAEVDRGCNRSMGVDVARTLGEALGMDWVFGVEFVEASQGGCEEGNAILSRYALGNPMHQFHSVGSYERDGLFAPYDWALDPGEPRTGRRSFVGADVKVAGGLMRLVSAHLENKSSPEERAGEIDEIVDSVDAAPRLRSIVAGDFNVFPDLADLIIDAPLFDRLAGACFVHPHADMPQEERKTKTGLGYQIDFAFVRGATPGVHGVVNQDPMPPSDHWPIWAMLSFP